jgi:protocatechuate 3,4-dioxygenase beta subunit
VGLGALLAACTGSSGSGAPSQSAVASESIPSASEGSSTVTIPTSDGTTATVSPTSASTGSAVDLLGSANACVLAKEETQGPYWFDVDSIRSNIRDDREGVALDLAIRVEDDSCAPISNAVVDVWHCDASGVYSGFESASTGGGGGAPGGAGGGDTDQYGDSEAAPTDEDTFLRGAQVSNGDGIVQFQTIYPGWYRGRTVHIHVKVHVDKKTVLTTQLFFDDDDTDALYAANAPYSAHTGRDTTNSNDSIFDATGMLTTKTGDAARLAAITLGVPA